MKSLLIALFVCCTVYVELRLASNNQLISPEPSTSFSSSSSLNSFASRKLLSSGCQLACQIVSGFNGKNGTNGLNAPFASASLQYDNPSRTAVPSTGSPYTIPTIVKERINFGAAGSDIYNTLSRSATLGTAAVPGSLAFTGTSATSTTVNVTGNYQIAYSIFISTGTAVGGLLQPASVYAYSHMRIVSAGVTRVLLGSQSSAYLVPGTYTSLSALFHVQLNSSEVINSPIVWLTTNNPSTAQGDTSAGTNLLIVNSAIVTLKLHSTI